MRTTEVRPSEHEPSGGVHVDGHMACTCNEVRIWKITGIVPVSTSGRGTASGFLQKGLCTVLAVTGSSNFTSKLLEMPYCRQQCDIYFGF